MSLSPHDNPGFNELLGNLCNEALDIEGRRKLTDDLTDNPEAQKMYVLYADLHVALRQHAQSLDDEEYALREAQAALDSLHQSCSTEISAPEVTVKQLPSQAEMSSTGYSPRNSITRWKKLIRSWSGRPVVGFSIAVLLLLCLTLSLFYYAEKVPREIVSLPLVPSSPVPLDENLGPAHLSGAVGARWAGDKLEITEGEQFETGQRLELVEGLAEVGFLSGAKVILQGPAILQIHDEHSASVSVGRVAAVVPSTAQHFNLRTKAATLASESSEFGAEVDVDGSLVTQVYAGVVEMKLNSDASSAPMELVENQGVQIDSASGRVKQLDQASRLHFVRYLPQHDVLVNLADIVAGGNGLGEGSGEGYHRGISLPAGKPVGVYGAPAQGDGHYHRAQGIEIVDGVFIPNGERGAVQVDSIGRRFSGFPATTDECWGGVIMARRPKSERSLPFMRLEFHGDNYGYVNWLHIASKAEELSPLGYGLIGMHSNCGITFDLHAIRAQNPNKKIISFKALLGNLEAKSHLCVADAWVLVDGQLRHSRKAFSREDGIEEINIPLTDRDRFLVLAVTDSGKKTAYDWVAFGDPVIETTTKLDRVAAGIVESDREISSASRIKGESRLTRAEVESSTRAATALLGGSRLVRAVAVDIINKLFISASSYLSSEHEPLFFQRGKNLVSVDRSAQI